MGRFFLYLRMRKFIALSSFLLLVCFLSQSFFVFDKPYKLVKVEGDQRDIHKLFYNSNQVEVPWASFEFFYSNINPIPNFYIKQDSQQLYAFRIYKIEDNEFILENYFPYEKMGVSFRDLNQFQWKGKFDTISDTIKIRLTNLPETNPFYLGQNKLHYPIELYFLKQ